MFEPSHHHCGLVLLKWYTYCKLWIILLVQRCAEGGTTESLMTWLSEVKWNRGYTRTTCYFFIHFRVLQFPFIGVHVTSEEVFNLVSGSFQCQKPIWAELDMKV